MVLVAIALEIALHFSEKNLGELHSYTYIAILTEYLYRLAN
jgi:hypothetical protein